MNKFRTTYCLILGLLMATTGFAQDRSTPATEAFATHFDSLYMEGNRCYVALGNAARLQRVIDEMQSFVNQGRTDGIIDNETADNMLISLRMDKLQGDLYYLRTDEDASAYGTSERYFKTALNFAQDTAHARIGDIFYYTFILHEELAQLYYKQGRYQQAYDEMQEAWKFSSNLPSDDILLDFISQQAICQARVGQFDQALENIQIVLDNYEGINTERYGEAMRKKAKILMLQQEQGNEDTGMAAPDNDALRCYKEYFALKKADALQRFDSMTTEEREPYWMSIRPFVVDCYRMENADPGFLYDVTLFSKGLLLELNREGGGQQTLAATWHDMQNKLSENDCAIEFIQYEKNGKQHMGALVLRKTGEPQFVRMTSPEEVLSFKIGIKTVEERLQSIHGDDRKRLDPLYNDTVSIPQMLWPAELIQAIGESRDVWFAPDGYQHRIAIEYLLPQNAKFNCHRLTSTRMLLSEATHHNNGSALIIGGVDFNHNDSLTAVSTGNDIQAYDHTKGFSFPYLEGSRTESSNIYEGRHNQGDTLLQGTAASEAAFRQLSSNYNVILISTHGLFHAATAPLGTDLKPCLTDNTLSESLLAMAGINPNLGSSSFDAETFDGVLSAREVSSLDLSSVDLVVLSCCMSGLGHITADGVYGIQRGFKNAGAKALIVTLWEIDDQHTARFMIHLNQKIGEGKSIYEAFQSARDLLRDLQPRFRDPFILIDAL